MDGEIVSTPQSPPTPPREGDPLAQTFLCLSLRLEERWYLEDRVAEREANKHPRATMAGVVSSALRSMRAMRHDMGEIQNGLVLVAAAVRGGHLTGVEAADLIEHSAGHLGLTVRKALE